MEQSSLRLLFVSTPVGSLGSGEGGGVELTLLNTVQVLAGRGYRVTVLAPLGSEVPNAQVIGVEGQGQVPAQTQTRITPIVMPPQSVLANLWQCAHAMQSDYDLIVNFAYDWLPFFLTPFFHTPVAHLVSMGSLTDAMDAAIAAVAHRYPARIGVYTRTQAETFAFADRCVLLGSGLDLSRYDFCETPDAGLAWLGRISPEKGLEDAVAAAEATELPLKILGRIQDSDYFEQIQRQFPQAPIEYLGFLPTAEMQAVLRRCRALLVTSRWVEAFGNVLIEALACGVPVIAYRRGGPAEIVRHGETGWLVEPDSVAGLIKGIQTLSHIDRWACRSQAEAEFSLEALGDRTEAWFTTLLHHK
ncbi:glycosyltransferase [Synechococcales cyanobacterium C]|uniref:Glycosyltransferase n=1 Tax=Petrachloros mirabilis ULC683 TaxID=2781853 RepID=A0A8K1ZYV7_9CYAN|nr:glycosyltransferase [Petrachloros mirabilis ULC683]